MSLSVLEQLKTMTKVVADTGDFELIKKYKPVDATTNPGLILKAAKDQKYAHILQSCIETNRSKFKTLSERELINETLVDISVAFGVEILKVIDGRVSSEVDARESFDTLATVNSARKIIQKYAKKGISKDRVLIKIAATWQGIQAAEILEKEGIHCNLTLIFDISQAVAAGEAKVTLISPFVGRITDWQMKNEGLEIFPEPSDDHGVISVKQIYKYYKEHGFATTIMGASFRNVQQIKALSGCDAFTISPALLEQLSTEYEILNQNLTCNNVSVTKQTKSLSKSEFLTRIGENDMATEKLNEGIKQFSKDTIELENIIEKSL